MFKIVNTEYLFNDKVIDMFKQIIAEMEFTVDADDYRMTEIENRFFLTNVVKYAMSHDYNGICVFGFELENGDKKYYYDDNGDVMLIVEDIG